MANRRRVRRSPLMYLRHESELANWQIEKLGNSEIGKLRNTHLPLIPKKPQPGGGFWCWPKIAKMTTFWAVNFEKPTLAKFGPQSGKHHNYLIFKIFTTLKNLP